MKQLLIPLLCLGLLPCPLRGSVADAAQQQRTVDYTRDVKPIFAKHCSSCHGVKEQESDLRLDTATGIAQGGSLGPAIVPGKSTESLLIKAVRGIGDVSKMPPEGSGLSKDQIEMLAAWIDQGAKAPRNEKIEIANADHWAFQPWKRPKLPAVKNSNWIKSPIDCFILARLEQKAVVPSPEADRATLIRRLSFDLLGLPPATEQVADFLSDQHPNAYERLVDRLLASPHYGERWGRHWLDSARYADSNGYTRDFGRQIWRYRDWVIGAINRDLPFDQFTVEQIAGDMLPDATLDQIIATGFHRNTLINEEGGTDKEQFRVDAVADRIATTGVVFLGLTLGCARCHEHKYDPISQREYYQIFAFLNDCEEPIIDAPYPSQVKRGDLKRRAAIRAQIADVEQRLLRQREEFDKKQIEWEQSITPQQLVKFPGPVQQALRMPLHKRDAQQIKLIEGVFKKTDVARKAFSLVEEIAKLRASEPKIPTTMVMRRREKPRETYLHKRGNFLDHGARVYPAVPAVLHPLPKDVNNSTRLDFARWLVDPANPLTSRVVMNRSWQRFFGRGIVETENDFGTQGSPPTHARLLDWLAAELVAQRWRMKAMHRAIVTSATYRQASNNRPELEEIDSRNLLLARQSRIRLEAEIVRDAALEASGLLTRKIGGASVYPPQPDGVFQFTQDPKPWNTEQAADRYRRGMYTHFWRSSPYPALMVFDFPDSNVTCTRRVRSNTPLQALTLANDLTFLECARSMAARVLKESTGDNTARAGHVFQLCFARRPSPAESERLLALVDQQYAAFRAAPEAAKQFANTGADTDADTNHAELATWTAACRVLMNLDEFITRE